MKYWILALVFAAAAFAESADPVQWSLSSDASKAAPGSTVTLRLTAKVQPGWHVYSLTPTPENVPIPTTVAFADSPVVESFTVYQPQPEKKVDSTLGYAV